MADRLRPEEMPDWPRAMPASLAASYVSLSPTSIRAMAARGEFPAPVHLGIKRLAWLREDLDRWLDRKAGRTASARSSNPWDDL